MQVVARLRPAILDNARTRLLDKYATLIQQAQDENLKAGLAKLEEEVREFALVHGYEQLKKLDPQLAAA